MRIDNCTGYPCACTIRNLVRVASRGDCNLPKFSAFQEGMKTMTCKELGGPCDQKLSAESWDEMVQQMVKHVSSNHPETAEAMKKMHEQDPKKWGRETKPKWDAAPAA
jgi:predicted small metal-binding protein